MGRAPRETVAGADACARRSVACRPGL